MGSDASPLALVTGGCRRLGARISEVLARNGYALALHGHLDAVPDDRLAQTIEAGGCGWRGFVVDFLDLDAVETLLPSVAAHFGRAPDLIVNSASLFGADRLDTVDGSDLAAHFAVNASAPALLTKHYHLMLSDGAHGGADRSIVNILDQRLVHPHADQFAYTLSKFALEGLTKTAANVLAPHVRVNAVAPGLTLPTEDYAGDQLDRLAETMPLKRLPTPEQVADAVLYLARATAVTGQTMFVDGGARMQPFSRDFVHYRS